MIKALYDLNERLVNQKEDYPKYRQSRSSVGTVLSISKEGELLDIISLADERDDKKRHVKIVPFQEPRTSGKAAYYLCDKVEYLLGINPLQKTVTKTEFELSAALHENIIGDTCSECAEGILAFFRKWEPEKAFDNPLVKQYEDFTGMMVFRVERMDALDDESLWMCWYKYYDGKINERDRCSVLGIVNPIGRIHPKIKNIFGGASMGASFVSFNNRAFESYGMEGNKNSRMSDYVVHAYSNALNYLLSNSYSKFVIGGATFVCWVDNANEAYSQLMKEFLNQEKEKHMTEEELQNILYQIRCGHPIEYMDEKLSADSDFYILGMAPNNGRLSVTFFMHNSFGCLLSNITAHYERLSIVREKAEMAMSPNLILSQILQPGEKVSDIPQWLSSDFLSSILNNTLYPKALYTEIIARIRADRKVFDTRVAMIKAYLIKNSNNESIKEVSAVKLNSQTTYQPYVLGRLFAVLERVQNAANGASTIKDSYFNSACTTPSVAFPSALQLATKHLTTLRRDKPGLAYYFDRQIEELASLLEESFPNHLTLEEQGTFLIGYYHQNFAMNSKKEKEE